MFGDKNQRSKSEVNVRKQKSKVEVMNKLVSAQKNLSILHFES